MADQKVIEEPKKTDVDFSKRAFVKTALLGGVAVAAGAVVAKKISSATPKNGLRTAYVDDDLQQDMVMKDKRYVLMTKEEKEQMVQMFVDSYERQA